MIRKYIKRMFKGQKRAELTIYAVVWLILFAAPMLSMYISSATTHNGVYSWPRVVQAWQMLAMFATAFALHNFLLAPLLVYYDRKWCYAVCVLVGLVCFETYQFSAHPGLRKRPPEEQLRPGAPIDGARHAPPPQWTQGGKPPKEPKGERRDRRRDDEPPFVFGGRDSVAFIIMLLLLALNIGVKVYFKSSDDRKRMRELERENLHQQLEYLKYQVNPHFFMNTLNNIHALVDIDPEQAKRTIEVLSHLMRYVLYEGNKPLAPLQRELDFLNNYVKLMRIRYADDVRITMNFPSKVPDFKIPPLLLITYVENAFKHGVSYERPSFITVTIRTDGQGLFFDCHNSRKPKREDEHGGVGLRNAGKRLNLIYGDTYSLNTVATDTDYRVQLHLPPHPTQIPTDPTDTTT